LCRHPGRKVSNFTQHDALNVARNCLLCYQLLANPLQSNSLAPFGCCSTQLHVYCKYYEMLIPPIAGLFCSVLFAGLLPGENLWMLCDKCALSMAKKLSREHGGINFIFPRIMPHRIMVPDIISCVITRGKVISWQHLLANCGESWPETFVIIRGPNNIIE